MSGGGAAPASEIDRRSVAALLASAFCTSAAVLAGVTALGKQVYDLTSRELDLGLLGLVEFAPAFVLALVTGTVADRFDRRRVVALAALTEAAFAVGLTAYALDEPTAVGPIFGLVGGFGIARAFAAPALRSLPADIVAPDRLPWLVARFSITFQVALVIGPVLGGFLYAADPALPYVAMAGLLAVGGLIALGIRPTPHGPAAPVPNEALLEVGEEMGEYHAPVGGARADLSDALEGLRFIRRTPIVLGAISLDLFAVLFGGAVALLPAIAEQRLGVGAVGLGWLRAAVGLGAGLVTAVLAFRPVRRRVGRILLVAVGVFGAATIVLGVTESYALAFVALMVLAGADAVSVFIRATLVPIVTPSGVRGRVLAVENVFIGASNELGAFESGVTGQVLGAAGAVVLGGAATLTVAALWWRVFPSLATIDEFPAGPVGDARAGVP